VCLASVAARRSGTGLGTFPHGIYYRYSFVTSGNGFNSVAVFFRSLANVYNRSLEREKDLFLVL